MKLWYPMSTSKFECEHVHATSAKITAVAISKATTNTKLNYRKQMIARQLRT